MRYVCRAFVSGLFFMLVFDVLQIRSGCIQICSACIATSCPPPPPRYVPADTNLFQRFTTERAFEFIFVIRTCETFVLKQTLLNLIWIFYVFVLGYFSINKAKFVV
jgi:hypothetical protein